MPEPLDIFREWLTKRIADQGQVYEQVHRAEPRIRGDYAPSFERGYLKALKDLLEELNALEGTPSQLNDHRLKVGGFKARLRRLKGKRLKDGGFRPRAKLPTVGLKPPIGK
jgi:hypothetical protein